jgi:hypothetical protein
MVNTIFNSRLYSTYPLVARRTEKGDTRLELAWQDAQPGMPLAWSRRPRWIGSVKIGGYIPSVV